MNEAKQAHVGLLPLVGGAVLPAYDSPRLRSAARPPVSVGDLDRQPADSHPQPLNENRSIVFWDSFFDRHVLGTVIRVRSRISRVKPFENVTLGLSVETFEMYPEVDCRRGCGKLGNAKRF